MSILFANTIYHHKIDLDCIIWSNDDPVLIILLVLKKTGDDEMQS